MGFFPLFIDISNKNCVVIGGGSTAARKIEKLLLFDAKITVIAPEICEEILKIKNIKIKKRKFKDSDLDGAFIAVGATNNKNLNCKISRICTQKNIPVNIVDDPKNCSFYFPAIVRKNNITAAVSTDGEAPIIARFLREEIEKIVDDDLIKISERSAECRRKIRKIFPQENVRKEILEEFFERCLHGKEIENIDDFVEEMRDKFDNSDRDEKKPSCARADSNGL